MITYFWLKSLPVEMPTALRISAFVSPSAPNNNVASMPAMFTGENKIFLPVVVALNAHLWNSKVNVASPIFVD